MKKYFIFIICFWPFLCNAQQSVEDSLNKIISLGKIDKETARAYNALAYEYTRKDVVMSRAFLDAAIAIGKKINDPNRLSSSYSQLVYLLHDTGKPDSAEYYLNEVKNLAMNAEPSEKDIISSNYYAVAAMYYKKKGDFPKAITFFENAIALYIKTGNRESTAGQTLNLGNTYNSLGNYQKATEQHLKSLRIFEEIGSDRGMSFCYQSLSNSFTQLKQYSKALLYANKSIKIKTLLKDRQGIGSAQGGFGDIYLGSGDFEKALYHYKRALNIAKELKNLAAEQENYLNIAKVYAAKKEIGPAIENFNHSKLLAKQLHDSSSVASIEADLIALQYDAEKTISSENKLKTTVQLFEERGDLNRQASAFKNMVDFYTAGKQFDKALEYNNKYYRVIDSIQDNELQLQMAKIEELYNVEKKEKEITILKKDQLLNEARLQKQNVFQYAAVLFIGLLMLLGLLAFNRNKLRQRMKELEIRNHIAADLHDEVGSSLSSIHMLSQMATQQNNAAVHQDILERMSSNAKETMDKMGDIVWMIKPGETEAGSMKQRIERFAFEICSSKNIALQMQLNELESIKLTMEQKKNIYLIFKEAVNNAVKYSGTEKIEINTAVHNKKLILQIKDFGKGFGSNIVKKGYGLDNMQNRSRELRALLEIESANNNGTSIKLTMPI